jgi:hypothetical protein
MSVSINEATGEVSVELGGQEFRLLATMRRMGDLERALQVPGLLELQEKLLLKSSDMTLIGLRALCVSGNEDQLDDLLMGPTIGPAIEAIFAALTAGLPKPGARGNAAAVRLRNGQRPGRDTDRLPTAS